MLYQLSYTPSTLPRFRRGKPPANEQRAGKAPGAQTYD